MQIGEGVLRPGPEPPPDVRNVTIRLTLFFDGTRNNRRNVQARQVATRDALDPVMGGGNLSPARAAAVYKAHGGGETSYEGDHSNVSRLEANVGESAPGYTYYVHVYTEGIGTTNEDGDSLFGYALGSGVTGIVQRVTKGLATAVRRIGELPGLEQEGTFIEKVTVDTCGFSRGAAAARHCVHRVLHDTPFGLEGQRGVRLKTQLENAGWDVGVVEVAAVGLFDTVSSYDVSLSASYAYNTRVLHLDAIREAAAVYQLSAAEEYRLRFSLTNIASSGTKGTEVFLPGAHSDVGGGYRDGPEDKLLVSGTIAYDVGQFLADRGWYRQQPGGSELSWEFSTLWGYRLRARRAMVRREYTFLALHLMGEFLRRQRIKVVAELEGTYSTDGVPGRDRVMTEARAGRPTTYRYWEDDQDEAIRTLRHQFLHISFADEFAMLVRVLRQTGQGPGRVRPWRLVNPG